MAIHIRELVVRTNIVSDTSSSSEKGLSEEDLEKLKKELIQECTQKVMDHIKRKTSR